MGGLACAYCTLLKFCNAILLQEAAKPKPKKKKVKVRAVATFSLQLHAVSCITYRTGVLQQMGSPLIIQSCLLSMVGKS